MKKLKPLTLEDIKNAPLWERGKLISQYHKWLTEKRIQDKKVINKQEQRVYRYKNKDKIAATSKAYREKNKDIPHSEKIRLIEEKYSEAKT